jgi:hypothetical protein
MGKLIFAPTLFFLSGCAATVPVQYVPEHAHPSRFTPGSRPYSFDCDTEAGKYSELNDATSGTNPWITGFMQVVTSRPGSAWPPDAGVVFAGTSKLPRVGLEAFVLPDNPAILQIAVRAPVARGTIRSSPQCRCRTREFALRCGLAIRASCPCPSAMRRRLRQSVRLK